MRLQNKEILDILNYYNGEEGAALRKKRLPVVALYTLRLNIAKLQEAYSAYEIELIELCQKYGCTPETMALDNEHEQRALILEVVSLLSHSIKIDIDKVDHSVLDACGNGVFDAITMDEYEHLAWLFD